MYSKDVISFKFISLRITKGRLIAAGLLLLSVFILLTFNIQSLLLDKNPDGFIPLRGYDILRYCVFTAAMLFMVFLNIELCTRVRRILGYACLILLTIWTANRLERMSTASHYAFELPVYYSVLLSYALVFLFFFAVSRNVFFTCTVSVFLLFIFSLTNYYLVVFRGYPLLPWDLWATETAAGVSGGYDLSLTPTIFLNMLSFATLLIFVGRLCGLRDIESTVKSKAIERSVSTILFAALFAFIFIFNGLFTFANYRSRINFTQRSQNLGFLPSLYTYITYMMISPPDGYSPDKATEIIDPFMEVSRPHSLGEPDSPPTIILILNESLIDPATLDSVNLSEDPLPFIRSLIDNKLVISGSLYASVFGGGTCNSEYELLTGNSTAFFPDGSRPFQQYISSPQPSIAHTLKDHGYSTIAVHPGAYAAWSRNIAYPNLGFDKYVYDEVFTVPFEKSRGWATDTTSYNQVIYEFENRDNDDPQLIYNVTIQNHGSYAYPDYISTVFIDDEDVDLPLAEQYFSAIRESDLAFCDLVNYFSNVDEPVLIYMVGDHWPNLDAYFKMYATGASSLELAPEQELETYRVPYILWANYPLQTGVRENDSSFNFAYSLILSAAGLEGTAYTHYLDSLSLLYPVITAHTVIDAQGYFLPASEALPSDPALTDYHTLIYNQVFDKKNRMPIFLP